MPHRHEKSFSTVTSGRFSIRTMDLEVSHSSHSKSYGEIHRNFSSLYKSQNSEKDKTLRNECFIETYPHFFAKRKSICYTRKSYYFAMEPNKALDTVISLMKDAHRADVHAKIDSMERLIDDNPGQFSSALIEEFNTLKREYRGQRADIY